MGILSKLLKSPLVRGAAAVYTGGTSEAYYRGYGVVQGLRQGGGAGTLIELAAESSPATAALVNAYRPAVTTRDDYIAPTRPREPEPEYNDEFYDDGFDDLDDEDL